jgi:hypothetical protein
MGWRRRRWWLVDSTSERDPWGNGTNSMVQRVDKQIDGAVV